MSRPLSSGSRGILAWLPLTVAVACTSGSEPSRPPTVEDHRVVRLPGRFVYHDRGGDLWVVDGAGSSRRRITDSRGAFDFDPDWSPDGREIVFRRDRGLQGETVESSSIMVVGADGIDARRLTPEMGSFPAWSPDGRSIAYTGEHGITLTSPGGGTRRRLSVSGECATWSPDASLIAYCSNDVSGVPSDDWDVVVTPLDGRWQRLTDQPGRDYPYAWSPDGRTLAFTSERDGANRAWLMRSDGTGQRRLTSLDSTYETIVDWLPDGRLLLAIESPDDGLFGWYLVTADGDVVGRITTVPPSVCCGEGQLDYWAP